MMEGEEEKRRGWKEERIRKEEGRMEVGKREKGMEKRGWKVRKRKADGGRREVEREIVREKGKEKRL